MAKTVHYETVDVEVYSEDTDVEAILWVAEKTGKVVARFFVVSVPEATRLFNLAQLVANNWQADLDSPPLPPDYTQGKLGIDGLPTVQDFIMKRIIAEKDTNVVGKSGMRYIAKRGGAITVHEDDLYLFDGKNKELESIGLGKSIISALEAEGITTLKQLKDHPDLTTINGIGDKTAKAILEKVNNE